MTPRARLALRRLAPVLPVVGIAGALALLPFPTCVLKLVTGLPCPGCGFTRATLALARGAVGESLRWHPCALPALVGFAVVTALALGLPEGHRAWRPVVERSLTLFAAALLATWALRLGGVLPPV
ncbi:MAG: DUF2752 domain-containing protein [Deltaproteobacteria bacterium]|nr:DUF2752 domain-containing protein [Deltaproteobacteria bacterium]